MNRIKGLLFIALCFILITPFNVHSQNAEENDSEKEKMMIAAREIMEASGTCALITVDKAVPMVRIMDAFPPERDFTVWFGTTANSRKVKQIKKNPNVTLYYEDTDKTGYVVIHGKAELVDDTKEKQKRWKSAWEDFYSDNREEYLLIKVSPDWMEILSVPRGIVGDPLTWETPTIRFE